ncbi:MAG: IPT/TIG domain-containing protein [Bdellovibrionales bacterium]|nr:IPT/TIG domain-containing protein [Bdellovibrionales bacterium]
MEQSKGSSGTVTEPTLPQSLSVSTISPAQVPMAGGTITLNGTGFDSSVTVFVGSSPCTSINIVSPQQLTCSLAALSAGDHAILISRGSDASAANPTVKVAVLPPSERACFISNGVGKETLIAGTSNYGPCTATSCNTDYTLHQNACHANTQPCNIDHGVGRSSFSNGSYGACQAISCDANFTLHQGACYASKRACPVDNGQGEQAFSGGSYGACAAVSCNTDYTLFQAACHQSRKSCSIANGIGFQEFSAGSYGACQASSCNTNFTLHQGACYANKRSCPVDNGQGEQTFSSGAYGTCVASSCNNGYYLKNGACLVRPANFPSSYASACPPTIPRGQLTVIDIGAFYVSKLTVTDGTKTIAENTCADTGSCTLLVEVQPNETTTYKIKGTSSVIDIEQEVTITVLDPGNPVFKVSTTPFSVTPHSSGSGYNFEWKNTDAQIQRLLLVSTDALGNRVVTRGYNGSNPVQLATYAHNPLVQTTYTLMACKGSYFKPEFAEMATVTVKPPVPSLAPVVGLQAECLGVARFEKSGQPNYVRLYGGGNINSTQPAATIGACREFMQVQQMNCTALYGPSCKVFGYYYSRDPKTDLNGSSNQSQWRTVLYRIFTGNGPTPVFPMGSAGACNIEFWREDGTSVSPGNQHLVSANETDLIEDCENHKAYSFLEISALAAPGSPRLTGTKTQTLVELITNQALVNKTFPAK